MAKHHGRFPSSGACSSRLRRVKSIRSRRACSSAHVIGSGIGPTRPTEPPIYTRPIDTTIGAEASHTVPVGVSPIQNLQESGMRTNRYGVRGLKGAQLKRGFIYFWTPPPSLQKAGIFKYETLGADFDNAVVKARPGARRPRTAAGAAWSTTNS
jgi:hypothetical protein